jgi:hypothetical protein
MGLIDVLDVNVFQLKCVAINFESDWLDFVLSNKATSHALLALVALSFDAEVRALYCCFRSNRHSAAAVGLVRRQLSNGSSVPDDTTVCVVALLTVSEVSPLTHAALSRFMGTSI